MSYAPNPQQQAAIDHPAQPLRIAAGAGTGKTATIVHRMAKAVAEGLEPEAALGITFTNKAAEELADRLRTIMPALAADGRLVEVTTYHGFAFSILQEFGALVGVERTAKVIGPGYVRQLLLESLGGRRYEALDLTNPAWQVANAADLASSLGDNLVTAADLVAVAPADPDDVWRARLELAAIVAQYEATKRRLDVVDYSDLVRAAHELLSAHPAIARRIRDRYDLVLLDEYQDTAPAQREILRLLFGHGFPLTAVGDSDQTIYEWRGASLQNFDAFPDHFPQRDGSPAVTRPLTTNYRSARRILHVANAVRGHLYSGPFAVLTPRPDAPEGSVTARWLRTAQDEATWIATEAKALHDEEGVAWRDIAVLFRKNRQITLVRDAMQDAGIPVEVASLGGLLDVPEIADLRAWLTIIEHPDDTPSLMRVLLGSRYRLGLADIAPLSRWGRTSARGADDSDDDTPWPLLTAIEHLDEIDDLRPEARRRLEQFRSLYRELVVQAQSLALVELCRRVLDDLDAWIEIDAMEPVAALSARLNLYRFLDLAQDWSPLEGRPSLEAFLDYLVLLEDERASDELDTARIGGEDAVTLLTVHRAKGLEWDTVFIPAVVAKGFPATALRHDDPLSAPASLPYEMRLDGSALPALDGSKKDRQARLRRHHEAGEWRTAYVAVTRATTRLYLSGAFWYGGVTSRTPSPLFETVASASATETTIVAEEPGAHPEPSRTLDTMDTGPDPLFEQGWAAALREAMGAMESTSDLATDVDARWGVDEDAYDAAMEQLTLVLDGLPEPAEFSPPDAVPGTSVTGLVTLASCPRRFYWSEIERLPRRPAAARRRGVEVHRQIELHNLGRIGFEALDPDRYDLVGGADGARRPFLAFLESRFASERPLFVETPIDLKVGDHRIRGRIDAIYAVAGGGWEIVDFKSGRRRDDVTALVQLQAYAVAAAAGAIGGLTPKAITVTFAYLGGEQLEEVSHRVDGVWLTNAQAALAELAGQIDGSEYATTPSGACHSCDFLPFCADGKRFVAASDS